MMSNDDLIRRLRKYALISDNELEDDLYEAAAAISVLQVRVAHEERERERLREALEKIASGRLFQHAHEFARAALAEQEKKE